MSSAKPAPTAASNRTEEPADADAGAVQLDRRLVEYAKFLVPIAVLVATAVAGSVFGPPAAVLVLAGGALVAVIAVFWASLRLLLGETPLSGADAYALGAPSTEEEQKQAVLRALKDLEFERSVGKISDEDYAELVAKYRAEAKRLLRILDADAQAGRERVAALVAKRLRRAGLADTEDGAATDEDQDDAAAGDEAPRAKAAKPKRRKAKRASPQEQTGAPAPDGEAAEAGSREDEAAPDDDEAPAYTCAACATVNDADAVFCKKCGKKRETAPAKDMSAESETEGRSEEAS
jgi:hypothetical protein